MRHRGNGQKKMEVIKYKHTIDLINEHDTDVRYKECEIYDCEFSVSFRVYNQFGNTLELHIFYK